jgi:glucose/arabinose dehydrogenase
MLKRISQVGILCLLAAACLSLTPANSAESGLSVPAGFHIEKIADVPNARTMAWGADGTLFVSTQIKGKVFAVTNVLGSEPVVRVIAEKLRLPNGIAFRNGDLFIAETNRILVLRDIEKSLQAVAEPEVLVDDLPAGKQHSWKYIAFGPDDKLYVTIGSPCNACNEPDYGLILRMNADGSGREVYARGIRNSVGLSWHPLTGTLWFTDNNRDMMGDNEPPGELNQAPEAGLHFGFPFCHGIDTVEPDPELAALGACDAATAPARELGPHVAPLGLAFYDGGKFPAEYTNQLFIAEHGSWNRSEKIGYRVSLVRLDTSGRRVLSYEPFAYGWLQDGKVMGRPADVVVAADGSLLVSDDKQGAIYRISYAGSTD